MHSQSVAGAMLALLSMASAQTETVCDPTEKECPPNPALGDTVEIDYTKGRDDFFEEYDGTELTYDKSKGAVFKIENEKGAPTIESPEFIFFGKLEVELMVAPGAGIVTSIVLQSLTLDEIDMEWVGGEANSVQTNYFSKGDTSTYDRGGTHPVSNASEFHTYTIDWTQELLTWSVDGKEIRVLTYEDAEGGKEYPQTPMQVKLGAWVGGRSDAPQGTVDWAGGLANFESGPTHAYYRRVSVTDYAGGVKGAKQYIYSDKTGTWESIFVDTKGDGLSAKERSEEDDEDDDASATTTGPGTAAAVTGDKTATTGETASTARPTTTSPTGGVGDDPEEDIEDAENQSGGEDGDEDAPGAAPRAVQALTWAGAVLFGVAVFANSV